MSDAGTPDDTVDIAEVDVSIETDVGGPGADTSGPTDTAAAADVNDISEPDIPPPPACSAIATITTPDPNDFFVVGQPISVTATVTDPDGGALDTLQVEWRDINDAVMATSVVDMTGQSTVVLARLQKGTQDIRASVFDENGPCVGDAQHPVLVCTADVPEGFNASLAAPWTVFGDASWSSSGYLEMTGVSQGKKGAIYNDAEYVYPGSVSIRFDMLTGGGSGSGADGFAMTIVETDVPADLPGILTAAKSGGGLAYASQGGYGNPPVFKAFTVEIDTWYNSYNGNNEFHTDPTQDDHIELMLDLDAGNSIAFTSAGEIEDQAWHSVRVDVVGKDVKVWLNGELKVEQTVLELDFRGGYIFFSGSTGYYTNYHQFDNLQIIHDCKAAPNSGS